MKTTKDRKSWFSMPRVPTSWWRYSMPPTPADNRPTSRDNSPETRAKSETIQISSPLPQNHIDPIRTSPIRDAIIPEDDPEYINTISLTNDREPIQDEHVSTSDMPPHECNDTPAETSLSPSEHQSGEVITLQCVPNISFSFFPDNDSNLIAASRIESTKNSLERTAKQLGSNSSTLDGENYENVSKESNTTTNSNTHMATGCLESVEKVINLDIRSLLCEGSSSENIKDVYSSSSSEYQSIVNDQCIDEALFQNDTKTYESEYSIFIGKSVEIGGDNVLLVDKSSLLTASNVAVDDTPMKSGNVSEVADTESPYASPRNSSISVSTPDIDNARPIKTEIDNQEIVEKSGQDEELYTQLKPRVFELKNTPLKDSESCTLKDRNFSSKSTKSLTDINIELENNSSKSASQNDLYELTNRSVSSPPKLSIRTNSVKLSDKFKSTPNGLTTSKSTGQLREAIYQNHERPSEPPPLPPVDWSDRLNETSSVHESVDCSSTVISSPSTIPDDDINYEDVEELEYCQQRARTRRGTLSKTGTKGPGIVRVKSKLGRVVRAFSGWWTEERLKLGEVIQKHAHAQAVGGVSDSEKMSEVDGVQEESLAEGEEVDNEEGGSDVAKSDIVLVNGSGKVLVGVSTVKRRTRKIGRPASRSVLIRSRYFPEGQNGFEELRRYIKQGGDFCKDLSSILQERSEAETQYAKSLSKLSCKLIKASKDSVGTVNQAWQRAGTQMEAQSEIHRAFAAALSEEVVKPLRQMVETQHRIRKNVESAVDKTGKSLSEWRAAETKSKKQSFLSARENEKLQDAMLDVRLGRNSVGSNHALHHTQSQKIVSDKESAKLESKRRKAEDSVKKADVEYYTFCIRAERARLEWETAVIRGSHCFQAIEEERLQNLKDVASCYLQHLQEMGPKMVEITDRLGEPVHDCDVSRDIQTVVSIKGTGQPIPEQLLPDFYAEHITLAMNRDRRRNALVKLLQLVKQDLDRERRGKQGVENLARALQETPNFGAEDSQQNVTEKLHHMRSMLTYLEAARYKVQSALAELDGRARGPHPLASHIQVTRDRQGLQQSVLKVPPWVRKESIDRMAGDSPDWTDRGAADGNSVQPDSDFDEFSSQGSEKDYQSSILTYPVISECSESTTSCGMTGQCKALYEYSANLYDELNLAPGDIINIHDKQPDGWWLGELNGVVGIFPATYVEEIK